MIFIEKIYNTKLLMLYDVEPSLSLALGKNLTGYNTDPVVTVLTLNKSIIYNRVRLNGLNYRKTKKI